MPLRNTVVEKFPIPNTGVSQGSDARGLVALISPTAPMGAEPVQLDPVSAPAVLKFLVGANPVRNVFSILLPTPPGTFVARKEINCAVGTWAGNATPTPDRSISNEPNAKSLSLRIGPPKLPANSLRRNTGAPWF